MCGYNQVKRGTLSLSFFV